MNLIGLDFETYSAADLPKVGLHNYIQHRTFRPLLAAVATTYGSRTLDFVDGSDTYDDLRMELMGGAVVVAHNAAFERSVLKRIGIDLPSNRFLDSAVLARACGYGSGLEAAAPQILGIDKIEAGKDLIKLFSIPGEQQLVNGRLDFDPLVIKDNPMAWVQFKHYCQVDAELSLRIVQMLLHEMSGEELRYADITMDMNATGWPVDLASVELMRDRALENTDQAILGFRQRTGATEMNLASHKQLVEWCRENGVRATSFDERHVHRLIARLERRLDQKLAVTLPTDMRAGYERVLDMLRTKQEVGGSSLKKLDTIIAQTGMDGRLRDQYLHCGAGATLRTTGRGVQMQNLKRLAGDGGDMDELLDPGIHWNNAKLAANLRQVFKAQHPDGVLIVGDFSSVESRGLAWQADEEWKLHAYRKGHDLYKVQAGRIYGKEPADVTKAERQIGKVAELACGYGAGAGAVKEFAANMGTELDEKEAADLVRAWRKANEKIVEYWYELDKALHLAIDSHTSKVVNRSCMAVQLVPVPAPESLARQVGDPGLQSLRLEMAVDGQRLFSRWVHGVSIEGRNVRYWKPSDRKTGDLWSDRYTDAKTGQTRMYSLYGGKLTGLLTQSLCRELFFSVLKDVHDWVDQVPNLRLVGQFHDEIVLEWGPPPQFVDVELMPDCIDADEAMTRLEKFMSVTSLRGFPLAAEVKADHRYTK